MAVRSRTGPCLCRLRRALAYLKAHFKLVILSNVDNASFAHSNARLGVDFDAIYTAEDVGSYKPDDANFTYMIGQLGMLGFTPDQVLHTAESMFHDHAPANRHGLSKLLDLPSPCRRGVRRDHASGRHAEL